MIRLLSGIGRPLGASLHTTEMQIGDSHIISLVQPSAPPWLGLHEGTVSGFLPQSLLAHGAAL